MPEPTKAQQMVDALEGFLATKVGVGQITIDGTTTQFRRDQAMSELHYWRRQLLAEQGKRPRAASINLGGF